jgi:hypothetical protein
LAPRAPDGDRDLARGTDLFLLVDEDTPAADLPADSTPFLRADRFTISKNLARLRSSERSVVLRTQASPE